MAFANLYLDRLHDTSRILQRASDRKLASPDFRLLRYYIAFLDDDHAEMSRQAELGEKQFANQDWMFHAEAMVSACSGKLKNANGISRHAVELAQQAGQHEREAAVEAGSAVSNALFGNSAEANSRAAHALELFDGRDSEYGAGLAFALAGNSSRAQSLVDELQVRFPEDTTVLNDYLPTLRGLIALNHGDASRAIVSLEPAIAYEGAVAGIAYNFFYGGLYSAYVRGEAYLAAHQGAQAAAEFQKILHHRGIVGLDPIGSLAYLQLGRAYKLSGDLTKAAFFYEQFLSRWRDADPDIPILKQAKAEYSKLQYSVKTP